MAYSTDEIQTAVEKLVNGAIRRPIDTLGTRRTDLTFSDVQEAAAGVFILKPLAPFYAILLGSKRLLDTVRAEATLVSQLRGQVAAVGRRVLPVESVESLFNATAALQQLEVAVAKQAPKDITKLPAFQRFALNVQDFLTTEGSKVKSGGDIVPTPQEARSNIPSLVRQLTEAHASLIELVTTMAGSIDDYNQVNLPALVAKGVVSKARQVMSAHADELDALEPEERLLKVRSVVLDVLAAKSVVQKFGSSSGPTTFVLMAGTGQPYSDATHPAVAASKNSDKTAPYAIYSGADSLGVFVDGALVADNILLTGSLMAQMNGLRTEVVEAGGTGFIIGNGFLPALPDYDPPNNNQLRFNFTNIFGLNLTVDVTLTLSGLSGVNAVPRTVVQICTDINTAFTTAGVNTRWLAEPYFFPSNFIGALDITPTVGSNANFTIPTQGGADLSFVAVGNLVNIAAGPNAGLWTVASTTGTSFVATKASGSPVAETLVSIDVGPAQRAVRIKAIQPSTQIMNEEQINYVGDSDVRKSTANTLGLNIFSQSFCRPTMAQAVADDMNVKLPKKLVCSAFVDGVAMKFRTEPGTFLQLVSSKLQVLGNITYTAGSPNAIDAVVPGGGLLDAGIVVGDVVVLRGGTPGGTSWTITSLTDSTCHATSAQTAINGTGVSLEFGTDPQIARWDAVDIPSGVLQGRFYVQKQGTSKLDIVLFAGLNAMQDPSTHLPLYTTGTYGEETLVITSRDSTVSSQIRPDVASTAAAVFFNTPTATAYGSSPWFQLPQFNAAVDEGDQLEVYAADYSNPSAEYEISTVEGRIIGIVPNMPSNESWSFNDQPPPFAKIRNGVNLNFNEYKALLEKWLTREINETAYFRDLNRYLNPLLQNATPTAEQVGTAIEHLEFLLDYLVDHEETMIPFSDTLEGAISIYRVDSVSDLDTLIKSYVEKGADRAVDYLLQGRFTSFFSMDQHDVSYSGAMQKGMRAIAQSDLPIRSTNRQEVAQSRLRGSAESPDYEFTLSDSDDVGVPDIPAGYDDTPR